MSLKKNKNWIFLITLLFLLSSVTALFLYPWIQANIEWEEKVHNLGPSMEVITNPYLALQKFLETRQITSKSKKGSFLGIEELSKKDSLLLANSINEITLEEENQLIDWIEHGGMLIVKMPNDHQYSNQKRSYHPLFSRLQLYAEEKVKTEEKAKDKNSSPKKNEKPKKQSACPEYLQDQSVEVAPLKKSEKPLKLSQKPWPRIVTYEEGKPGKPTYYKRIKLGEGEVLVLNHINLWNNYEIACFDNAYFLVELIKDRDKLWIAYDVESPNLLSLLLSKAPLFLLSLGLVLVFWLASLGREAGPRCQVFNEARQDFLEHLKASGEFYKRQGLSLENINAIKKEKA